jgi:hypothetical protein
MDPTDPNGLSAYWREILASAYELSQDEVARDTGHVQQWVGSDDQLIAALEARHDWRPESELASYFLAALRAALRWTQPRG